MLKHKNQKLKMIESKINQHLFLICAFVTVSTMVMTAVDFFSRGAYSPSNIDLFYLGVLVIYSFHKELFRWVGERKNDRQGEYFVYGWIIFTVLFYIINFAEKDYYIYSSQGESLTILRDTSILTLEVLAVFMLTRTSKILKVLLK